MDTQDLKNLFKKEGIGIMGTSNKNGWVNMAIYTPPIITSEGNLIFAATERLTYKNLTENPNAMFMYIADNKNWNGIRIKIHLIKDETSGPMIERLKSNFKEMGYHGLAKEIKHALYFRIEDIRPLKG